jgi:hypothetical protein
MSWYWWKIRYLNIGEIQTSEHRLYFSCLGNFRYLNIDSISVVWKLQTSEYRFYFSCLGNFRHLNINETSDIWEIRASWPRLYIQGIWKIRTSWPGLSKISGKFRHFDRLLYLRYLESSSILISTKLRIFEKLEHLDFDYPRYLEN